MTPVHPYFTYTTEILSWRLGEPEGTASAAAGAPRPEPGHTAARAGRILRAARDRREVLLLGLGTGELATALAEALPPETALTVLSLDPAAAARLRQAGGLAWRTPDGSRQLLADTSRQALLCLPAMLGTSPDTALVTVNPEPCPPDERAGLLGLRRLLAETLPLPENASPSSPAPKLTLALLARSQEPDLPGFFSACAGLASQAVVVWDGEDVPETAREAAARLAMPVRHLARPLGHDFAAQRNALLTACPPGWIISLDPDERPGPGFSQTLARLVAIPNLGGAYFPRLTLYPDPDHAKVGHGLWPDLQLRLFTNATPARPRYVRPVHERLEGLAGMIALALDAPLLHYNRLVADDAAVTAKLTAFDAAAGTARHHLSRDYPSLPLDFFLSLTGERTRGRILRLPGRAAMATQA